MEILQNLQIRDDPVKEIESLLKVAEVMVFGLLELVEDHLKVLECTGVMVLTKV